MIWLILGLALWSAAHLFKRVAPGPRAALQEKMGDASKAIFAVALVAAVALMVIGYRGNMAPVLYTSPGWMVHLNNTLMVLAIAFFGLGHSKSRARQLFRHPQLYGFKTWAVAHLLVNGDLASVVLFGGLLAWAVFEVIVLNRAEPRTTWRGGSLAGDIRFAVITLVVYLAVAGVHVWLGVWPFPVAGAA